MNNLLLEEVYKYYSDERNYLGESLNEDSQCVAVDDNMFSDLMDMVQHRVYEEIEDGHILIPTTGSYTFNIAPNGDCYVEDEKGNEYEAAIDRAKLQQILRTIESSKDGNVSEGRNNPFTKVEQDPDTNFITFTKKDSVSPEEAMQSAHDAVMRGTERSKARYNDRMNNPSLKDRRNDPEYMDKVDSYWKDRRQNMAEPHGFGTSGTKSMFPLEETSDGENSVYDLANDKKGDKAQFAANGMGYINEAKLRSIVDRVVKQTLNKID